MRNDSAGFRPVLPSAREETGCKSQTTGFQEIGHHEERTVFLLRKEDVPVLHREAYRPAKEIAPDSRAPVSQQGVLPGDGQAGTIISPSPTGNDRREPAGWVTPDIGRCDVCEREKAMLRARERGVAVYEQCCPRL